MNTDRETIKHLQDIIRIKDERIEGLNKSIDILSSTMEKVSNKPLFAVKKARELLSIEIPKARQGNKETLKKLKAILDYE